MKKHSLFFLAAPALALALAFAACQTPVSAPEVHPQWARQAVMYEVNTRQFTPEGTFEAFADEIPALREAGVDILWFMPIHPIGVEGRKGTLGSYYSISDYYAVNPEFGTLEDFKKCLDIAHSLDMKVIIDLVAGHTSRDAKWLAHKDWYEIGADGEPAFLYDWSDVARLDYTNNQMREAMLSQMKYWVDTVGIDGFRCDVADCVPVDFWNYAVEELEKLRPDVYMLAEGEQPSQTERAFDSYYAWNLHHTLNDLAQGTVRVDALRSCLDTMTLKFGPNAIPLLFTSNHDENSWNGTEFERMGDAARQMAVLTYVLPGMPLMYTGQEVGNTKRLEFFEKDTIDFSDPLDFRSFYTKLGQVRKVIPALQVPPYGGVLEEVTTTCPEYVYAFTRAIEGSRMLALFNFSAASCQVQLTQDYANGSYTVVLAHPTLPSAQEVTENTVWEMAPWGYVVLNQETK